MDGPIRVLHVDDDPDFAELTARFLEQADDRITVETATSADVGLDWLTDGAIDCIVSDYAMPGRDGIAFLEAVRNEYPALPFILYTGKGSEEVASAAISAGATDYLGKGSGNSQYTVLANRIVNAVSQYRSEMRSRERERELEEQRQLYRTLVEQSPNGVMIVQDKEIELVNTRMTDLVGRAESDLVGRPFYEIMAPEYRDLVERRYEQRVSGKHPPRSYEIEIVTSGGDRRVIDLHVSRIQYRNSPATLATFNDVTRRKEREQALQHERDRLDEFASVVSHDLRNPLQVATGRLELAREECDSDHLCLLADALDRMERIVDDVLWLAREGQSIGDTEPVDLREVTDAAWTLVADDADGAELVYADDGGEREGAVVADSGRLSHLFENLFRNAIDHGGPDVTVRVEPTDAGFAVEDDGPGIPTEKRDRVFDAGYSTSETGTGFGLNIVEEVVDAHGWSVAVTDGTDGGARFEVTGVRSPG